MEQFYSVDLETSSSCMTAPSSPLCAKGKGVESWCFALKDTEYNLQKGHLLTGSPH